MCILVLPVSKYIIILFVFPFWGLIYHCLSGALCNQVTGLAYFFVKIDICIFILNFSCRLFLVALLMFFVLFI